MITLKKIVPVNVFLIICFLFSHYSTAQTNCSFLSNGKKFCDEALMVSDASEMALFGQASYSDVAKDLQKWGLKPIRIQNGNAVVVVDFINYKSTTIGPYREFILTFPAQTMDLDIQFIDIDDFIMNSSNISNDPKNTKFGYYMKKLILDGEVRESVDFAIVAGREISGFPKEAGTVDMSIDSFFTGFKDASVRANDGSWGLNFNMITYFGNYFNASVSSASYQFMTGLGYLASSRAEKQIQSSRPMPARSWENRMSAFGSVDGFPLNSIYFEKWLFIPRFSMKFNLLKGQAPQQSNALLVPATPKLKKIDDSEIKDFGSILD